MGGHHLANGDLKNTFQCCLQTDGHITLHRMSVMTSQHDDVIKWKHFPRYWPFVWGIHLWPVNSPHKYQWCRALMFSLIFAWINGWVNNRKAGDLRRHRAHYDATAMNYPQLNCFFHNSFRLTAKNIKIPFFGPWSEETPVTGRFNSQSVSNAERVSISWRRHHDKPPTSCAPRPVPAPTSRMRQFFSGKCLIISLTTAMAPG